MRSSPTSTSAVTAPPDDGLRPTVPGPLNAGGLVGEPVTVAGITLTVESVVFDTCNDTAPARMTVAEVTVSITNSSDEPARYGSLDWTLNTVDASYSPEFSDCIPSGERPPLSPGVSVSRTLSFVVPPDVEGLELVYLPGVSPNGSTISVDLEG